MPRDPGQHSGALPGTFGPMSSSPRRPHNAPPPTPDPDWFDVLRPGDVLQHRNGTYRVVRRAAYRDDPAPGARRLICVEFVKLKRSRYESPTTIYFPNELKHMGFRYIGARLKLDSPLDKRLACYTKGPGGIRGVQRCGVSQDDVVGVIT